MTITTPDAERLIEHRDHCRRALLSTFRHRITDHVVTKCRSCGANVDHNATPEPGAPDTPPAIASGYRCGNHLDIPVNWRGRGCTECAKERRRRRTTPRPQEEAPLEYR